MRARRGWFLVGVTTLLACGFGSTAAAPAPKELSATELDRLWKDLGHSEGRASDAADVLFKHPKQAVALVKERCPRLGPFTKEQLDELVSNIDDDDGAVRRKALADVRKLGQLMVPTIQAALKNKPTLEMKQRCEELLVELKTSKNAESLRAIWSAQLLEVLDYFGHADARPVLRDIAKGHPEAYPTEEARGALERIAQREKGL